MLNHLQQSSRKISCRNEQFYQYKSQLYTDTVRQEEERLNYRNLLLKFLVKDRKYLSVEEKVKSTHLLFMKVRLTILSLSLSTSLSPISSPSLSYSVNRKIKENRSDRSSTFPVINKNKRHLSSQRTRTRAQKHTNQYIKQMTPKLRCI